MYQVYIERQGAFSPDMVGEYKEFDDAQARALKEKAKDETIRYTIEETNGGFDSYGNLLTTVVEEG